MINIKDRRKAVFLFADRPSPWYNHLKEVTAVKVNIAPGFYSFSNNPPTLYLFSIPFIVLCFALTAGNSLRILLTGSDGFSLSYHLFAWFAFLFLTSILWWVPHTLAPLEGYVLLENGAISSYRSRRKPRCTVDTAQPVYYALHQDLVRTVPVWFVVVSNQPFSYISGHRTKGGFTILTYDQKTQIIFPYNEHTISFVDDANWHCMNHPDDGKRLEEGILRRKKQGRI